MPRRRDHLAVGLVPTGPIALNFVAAAALSFATHNTPYFPSRRGAMPVYISRGRFTPDAIKGMLNKPENREQAVTKPAILAAAAGGSLSDIETTIAMTAKDAHATFESASKAAKEFRSAGRS
jgi:hypothetical protein